MRHRKFVVGFGLVLALFSPALSGSTAHAADPTAAELTDQAYERYEAGDYPTAVSLYMKAYNLSVDSRILFNVAQIYDKKVQDRELALEYYRRYLKSTTTEPDLVKKATERVTELQRQQDDLKSKTLPTATASATAAPGPTSTAAPSVLSSSTTAPTAAPPPSRPVWIGYATAGVLAAGAVVTGALALSASGDVSKGVYTGTTVPADLTSTADKARTLGVTTDVLIGGAVVAAAVTLIVHLSSPSRGSESKSAKRLSPSESGVVWRF
ncbi:MAG: hypothetical protein IPK82_41245 [Polyangiaceae bacterium]|nr:hypothetical protein [Polyangiaceae bacterium]